MHHVSAMPEAPRLFLITAVVDATTIVPCLEAALDAADVACILLRISAHDEGKAKMLVRTLAPIIQRRDAALLVDGDARLAARTGADGVHVLGTGRALDDALASLKPERIVGVGGLSSRDAAMTAGEAGADYLMFGTPGDGAKDHAAVVERVTWWAEIFNVPCVGFASCPEHAAEIAGAGADFVALYDDLWDDPAGTAATIRAVLRAIDTTSEAAV